MIVIVVELRTIVVVRDGDGFSHAVESRDSPKSSRTSPHGNPTLSPHEIPGKFAARCSTTVNVEPLNESAACAEDSLLPARVKELEVRRKARCRALREIASVDVVADENAFHDALVVVAALDTPFGPFAGAVFAPTMLNPPVIFDILLRFSLGACALEGSKDGKPFKGDATMKTSMHKLVTLCIAAAICAVATSAMAAVNNLESYLFRRAVCDCETSVLAPFVASLIARLDAAGRLYSVVIIKTPLTMAYTTTFFELDCAYWNGDQQKKLDEAMGRK